MWIQFKLLQEIRENGLGAKLKTTRLLTLLENDFDNFLEHGLPIVLRNLKLGEHGVLGGQDLEQSLHKAMMKQFGILQLSQIL